MGLWRGMLVFMCVAAGGCFPRETQSIGAVDPAASIPAMQEAARKKDKTAVPALVKQLSSDDPAVRFYAINALKEITGQTFNYRYFDDAGERKPAVERWEKWVVDQRNVAK